MTPHAMASAGEPVRGRSRATRGTLAVWLVLFFAGGLLAQPPGKPSATTAPAGKVDGEKKEEEKEAERGLVTAILVGRLWTGNGPALQDAVILVREGEIIEVGKQGEVEIPPFARRLERPKMTVTPGFVHPAALLYTPASGFQVQNEGQNALNEVRDVLDPRPQTSERAAKAGFTTLAVGLSGGGFAGRGALVRPLAPEVEGLPAVGTVIREDHAVLSAGFRPRTSSKTFFEDTLTKAKAEIERRKKEAEKKPEAKAKKPSAKKGEEKKKKDEGKKEAPEKPEEKNPEGKKDEPKEPEKKNSEGKKPEPKKAKAAKPDPKLQPVIEALEGEMPVVLALPGASAFLRLEEILEKHEAFRPALLDVPARRGRSFFLRRGPGGGGTDLWRVREPLKELGVSVIITPELSTVPGTITRRVPPRMLLDAGIPLAFVPTGENDSGYEAFRWHLGELVRHGMAPEEVLRAVTRTPAEILGVQERYGSVEKGRKADLLFFDGDPFAPTTRLVEVRVEGEVVWSEESSS